MTSEEPVLLLPGMGADHRLFTPLRPWLGDFVVPPWPPTQGCKTIRDYAMRLREELPEFQSILGGASFRGALAIELAHLTNPRCLILLGAPLSRKELRWPLRVIAAAIPPRRSAKAAASLATVSLGQAYLFGLRTRPQIDIFRAMLRDTPSERLAWMVESMLTWESPGLPDCPVYRLHGTVDRLIHPKTSVEHWIEGAGHAFTLTHADATGRILQELLKEQL